MKEVLKRFWFVASTLLVAAMLSCHNASTGIHKNDFDSVHADSENNPGNYNGNAAGSMTMDSIGSEKHKTDTAHNK